MYVVIVCCVLRRYRTVTRLDRLQPARFILDLSRLSFTA